MIEENNWKFMKDTTKLQELLTFWEKSSKKEARQKAYYRKQLIHAQELIGRIVQQSSERIDSVRLTSWCPYSREELTK